jgi:hypothetical protein
VNCKRMYVWGHLLIFTLGKASMDGKARLDRIGECNFMWSERSSEVSNWFFSASACFPRARQLELQKDVCVGHLLISTLGKASIDGKTRIDRIGECNFMWSESSTEVSNWFFLPLYVIHVHDNLTCKRMSLESPHFYVGKRRRSTGKPDLTELENAISCDRKVQVKFQTDFFLPMYVIHAARVYKCARQRDLQ